MVWRRRGDSSKTREDGELVGVGAGDEESRVEGDAGRRLARRGRDRQQPYGAFEGRMEAQQRIWRRSRRDGWHLEPQSPYASPDFFDGLHAHIDRPCVLARHQAALAGDGWRAESNVLGDTMCEPPPGRGHVQSSRGAQRRTACSRRCHSSGSGPPSSGPIAATLPSGTTQTDSSSGTGASKTYCISCSSVQ